jgi:hypothetical protein
MLQILNHTLMVLLHVYSLQNQEIWKQFNRAHIKANI